MRVLKVVGIVLGCLFLAIVLTAGYFGFIPGLSALFGSDQPRDLGVPPTEADRVSANAKLQQTVVPPTGEDLHAQLSAGVAGIDTALTEREFAAHLEEMHPVRDLQVKIANDDSVEITGRIDRSRIPAYLDLLGLESGQQLPMLNGLKRFVPGNPVFYGRGRASIDHNLPMVALERVEFGRLPVSTSAAGSQIENYIRVLLQNVTNLSIERMVVESGQVKFVGTTPTEVPAH